MPENGKSDIVIVGGKAAGPKTAATLARRLPDAKITLFQKEKHLSYSSCGLPFFASGDINSFEQLTFTPYGTPKTPEFYKCSKGFDFIPGMEVIAVNRDKKIITIKQVETNKTFDHSYKTLVLATGSIPVKPSFPTDESPQIRTFTKPEDAIHFRQLAEQGKVGKAVIIGGGFIGCELAEAVGGMWGIETSLIEKENRLLPHVLDSEMSKIVEREMARQNVNVILDCEVTNIKTDDDGNPVVSIENQESITTDYVFICLGMRPNANLADQCGLEVGETGGIIVDKSLRTSDPSIYAGGDCVELWNQVTGKRSYIPMGSLANRHGRIIAENIAGGKMEFPGITGAFVVKVFDINVGAVGITQSQAENEGMKIKAVWGTFVDKPDYHPETKRITVKMIYSHEDNRLLGLQAVGIGDICRRIDVFSSFLQRKATIDNLLEFEHGYAPPYADVLDPLHEMAGVARAQQRGMSFLPPDSDFKGITQWVDVREIEEAAGAPWPLSDDIKKKYYFNFPLNDLRANIDKLDPGKKTVIICGRGSRSYQAALILKYSGFNDVHVIGGGSLAVLS